MQKTCERRVNELINGSRRTTTRLAHLGWRRTVGKVVKCPGYTSCRRRSDLAFAASPYVRSFTGPPKNAAACLGGPQTPSKGVHRRPLLRKLSSVTPTPK